MQSRKIIILTIVIMFFMISEIYPQCCSGGVPISGSLGLSSSDENSWQFLLTYDYNRMQHLFEANHKLNDNSRKRITNSSLFEINYGLTKRITLTGMFSFIRQERVIENLDNEFNNTNTLGLGDAIFIVKYRLISSQAKSDYNFLIGVGPKIPLGRTDFTNENGLLLSADLQPGSGAWDLMLWSIFERYNFIWSNLSLASALSYRYSGTNHTYFMVQDYRFGNELTFNLQTSYRFFLRSMMFDGLISLRYRNQKHDLVDKEIFPNSGGNFVYLIPGFNYNLNPEFSFYISSYIPLYRNTDGTQLTTNYKFVASLSFKIGNKNNIKILPDYKY